MNSRWWVMVNKNVKRNKKQWASSCAIPKSCTSNTLLQNVIKQIVLVVPESVLLVQHMNSANVTKWWPNNDILTLFRYFTVLSHYGSLVHQNCVIYTCWFIVLKRYIDLRYISSMYKNIKICKNNEIRNTMPKRLVYKYNMKNAKSLNVCVLYLVSICNLN